MKIQINYDLLQKIRESKTGFSLKRTAISTLFYGSFASIVNMPNAYENNAVLPLITIAFLIQLPLQSIFNILSYKNNKITATDELKKLSQQLKNINVSTSYEILKQSYTYKTNHKIRFNEYLLPYIIQNKYIMVPTYNNGEISETSLVQEHNIGSKYYSLSCGSPNKVLKLAYSSI